MTTVTKVRRKTPAPPRGYLEAFWRLAVPFKVGDKVRIEGRPDTFEVTDTSDPGLVTLQAPSGATLKAGRRVVTLVGEGDD